MDPQSSIITLDVIQSLVPEAQSLTAIAVKNAEYADTPPAGTDFFAIERGEYHFVYWLDGNNDAHRISRAKNGNVAKHLIWFMTELVNAKMAGAATEPSAPAADESEISLPIPSPTEFQKSIAYDRKTGDFACRLNGQVIGYRQSNLEAESLLNETVYEALRRAA